ncbi:hypothetical protein ACFS3C_00295 [Azotobacter vinelandii]
MADVLLFAGERAFFSDSTPQALRYLLNNALCAGTPDAVEALLLEARRRWPQEPDAHIGLYKFYFVSKRYEEAEAAAWAALRAAAQAAGFDRNYRRLQPGSADWSRRQGGRAVVSVQPQGAGRDPPASRQGGDGSESAGETARTRSRR